MKSPGQVPVFVGPVKEVMVVLGCDPLNPFLPTANTVPVLWVWGLPHTGPV